MTFSKQGRSRSSEIKKLRNEYCYNWACMTVQLCPTLYDAMEDSSPGFLSMEFSRQEYWSGLPFPTLGDPPNPGIKPSSLAFPAFAGEFFTTVPPGKPLL